MRKIFAFIVCFSLVISTAIPASATVTEISYSERIVESCTEYLEIVYHSSPSTRSRNSSNAGSFEIMQFKDNQIIQRVEGTFGGSYLSITNYKNGLVTTSEIQPISAFITLNGRTVSNPTTLKPYANNGDELLGTITYNKAIASDIEEKIKVYSYITNSDYESFTINGKASDTLAAITGAIASVVSIFIPVASLPGKIAIAIVSALGGSVAGEAIGIYFTEDVAVSVTDYAIYGYHALSGQYSPDYTGSAKQVLTEDSNYYSEWFYEGFTPYNWKDGDDLAICLWNNLIGLTYPHVKYYS